MEGVPSSRFAIKVDTTSATGPRVTISTGKYSGGISSVGLFTSSNVVIGTGNAIVLYATGAVVAKEIILNGGSIAAGYAALGGTQTFTAPNTFAARASFGDTNIGQIVTASATFTSTGTMRLNSAVLSVGLYRLTIGFSKDTTAATVKMRFNLDSGANYDTSAKWADDNGIEGVSAGDGFTYCYIAQSAAQTYVANGVGIWSWTAYVYGVSATDVTLSGMGSQQVSADVWSNVATGCRYTGASSLTNTTVISDSGLFTDGYMSLVRIQ